MGPRGYSTSKWDRQLETQSYGGDKVDAGTVLPYGGRTTLANVWGRRWWEPSVCEKQAARTSLERGRSSLPILGGVRHQCRF